MKIEMGESLFYSWLRHVKDCQIVQNNWKPSPQWNLLHADELEALWQSFSVDIERTFGYKVFKKNASLTQFLQQAECDALGVSVQDGTTQYYAVDVAFHESGLNYGTREETVAKVLAKCIRTAFCIYGYMNSRAAEIVFASPKINPAVLGDILPCVEYINQVFQERGYHFEVRVICNNEFETLVLNPILIASEGIADTSELFLRGYQLFSMFENRKTSISQPKKNSSASREDIPTDTYNELKIGKLAQTVLRGILESGCITGEELQWLQTASYSKQMFDLEYPLLAAEGTYFESGRYYAKPLDIEGQHFYMCSQWFETPANNDRPYLLRWIEQHKSLIDQSGR